MSELKITGSPTPVVGKEELYSVNQLLPSPLPFQNLSNAATNPFEQPVEWSVHILENGRWIKKEENNKRGNKVSYKFIQKSLERKGIRILAKRGNQVARLDVKPHNAEKPKIDSIEFLDKQGNKPSKPLSYGQTLKARVHCLHMERRKVYATLWEDNDKSKENYKIETRFGTVIGGIVDIDFTLRPSAPKAALNKDKTHKYYVTTVVNNKNMPSNVVNVKELEPPVPPFKKKTPIQQPKTPTAPVATKNGVSNVYITDINGQPIQGTYKSKKIKVWIESKGLQGKEIKLTVCDEDLTTNDLIYHNNFKISKDLFGIEVHLDKLPVSKAGRLEGDIELFVDIEVLQNQTHTKSGVVNVDAKAFKQDSGAIVNTVLKIFQPEEKKEDKKKEEKGGCYCQNQGIIKTSCKEQGALIKEDDYKEVSKRLGIEVEVMKAIAKQESKRNSFWKKGQATILFERHKMWKYLKKTGKTDDELKELKKKYPRIVNNSAGGYGQYSEQYEKLKTAKEINYTCALKSCSWGKFQVMGFNYAVAFSSPEEMEKAVNMCELQQFNFFVGYLENTNGLLNAMKNKDWESIAEKYNGSSWKTTNPDYANNIKKYYNELK
jgi:hypothetical protein